MGDVIKLVVGEDVVEKKKVGQKMAKFDNGKEVCLDPGEGAV